MELYRQFLLEGVGWIEESDGAEALGEHDDRGPGPAVCMKGSNETLLKDC